MKTKFLLLIIVLLLLCNFAALYQIVRLRSENRMWKNKIILSIEDQQSLYEHRIEGDYLGDEIFLLAEKYKKADIQINKNRYFLIYLFKGVSCDRCFSDEINIFKKYKETLKSYGILPVMVFTEMSERDYINIVKSADIEDISVWADTPRIFIKYNELRNSILLFVGKKGNIIMATILDYYRDKSKSDKFYNRIIELMENL